MECWQDLLDYREHNILEGMNSIQRKGDQCGNDANSPDRSHMLGGKSEDWIQEIIVEV